MFLYAIYNISKFIYNEKYYKFILLLIIFYPAIIPCLSGPNKEITGYLSILFFINYLFSKRYRFIILSFLFSIFTRFELTLLLILWFFSFRYSYQKKFTIAVLVILASFIIHYTGFIGIHKITDDVREGSLGYNLMLANFSKDGFYFISVFPKTLLNFFGSLLTSNILRIEGYSLLLYLSQLLFFSMCLVCIYKRSLTSETNIFIS